MSVSDCWTLDLQNIWQWVQSEPEDTLTVWQLLFFFVQDLKRQNNKKNNYFIPFKDQLNLGRCGNAQSRVGLIVWWGGLSKNVYTQAATAENNWLQSSIVGHLQEWALVNDHVIHLHILRLVTYDSFMQIAWYMVIIMNGNSLINFIE